ncbi:MAG: MaoC/PaaZ C-terminal domain-containing protein [Pirellulaceae bacterium]
MTIRLTFEQLEIGNVWTSPSRTITETDVVNFGTTTGDLNPLHHDYEFAKNSHYRQPVAHGLLGLSWAAGLSSVHPYVETVAFVGVRDWEFSRPLFIGDTVHVVTEVIEKQESPKRNGRVYWRLQLINQRGEVAQRGVFETLVRVASGIRRPNYEKNRNSTPPAVEAKNDNKPR